MNKKILVVLLSYFSLPVCADFQDDLPVNFPKTEKNNNSSTNSESSISPVPSRPSNLKPSLEKQNPKSDFDLGDHNNNAPILFSGEHGSGSRNKGILNLVGNAYISQDNTTLRSNKAQLFTHPGQLPSPGSSQILKAVAIGNVVITKSKTKNSSQLKATSDEAEFIVADRMLILKGNAKVWRDQEYINGANIKINLVSGDVEIIQPQGNINPNSLPNTNHNLLP